MEIVFKYSKRKAAGKDVVDIIEIQIDFDAKPRTIPIHPKMEKAFKENKEAKLAFDKLSPSRQKEILRYINSLKSEESVDKDVQRAIAHLISGKPFIGKVKSRVFTRVAFQFWA
ncbi:MAG TPA: YdeI/OmpD-associated family protein [Chitinophagaceae bacterium]